MEKVKLESANKKGTAEAVPFNSILAIREIRGDEV
jgi:hypothetical protein